MFTIMGQFWKDKMESTKNVWSLALSNNLLKASEIKGICLNKIIVFFVTAFDRN